jgi:hypothetical protein
MAYILVDTREKDNAYVLKDFKKLEYNYKEIKLDEGDYQSSFNPNCVIDLKNGLHEVQANIAGTKKERARFMREVQRCADKNKKLIVLVREEVIYNIYGVQFWKSPTHEVYDKQKKVWIDKPYTKVSGKFLMKVMERFERDYGIEWHFCKRKDTAAEIVKLLNWNGGKINKNGY